MLFGLTRGEMILTAFVFFLIYGAGLLPKVAARLGGKAPSGSGANNASKTNDD